MSRYTSQARKGPKGLRPLAVAAITALATASAGAAAALVPSSNGMDPDSNQTTYWEAYLQAEGFTHVACTKLDESQGPTFTVPAPTGSAGGWVALLLKAAAGAGPYDLVLSPVVGQAYSHSSSHDIGHIMLCAGEAADTGGDDNTGSDDNTRRPLGPIVETDVPAPGESTLAAGGWQRNRLA